MLKKALPAVLALTMIFAFSLDARAEKWTIDPVHSSVNFHIKHVVGQVTGHFERFEGNIEYDPQNPLDGNVSVTIEVDSIDTGVKKRDQDLKSPKFFNTEEHPVMTFESDQVQSAGVDRFVALGTLTIKGVSRQIALPFKFFGRKDYPVPKQKCKEVIGVWSRITIDRFDYNVGTREYFNMGAAGKDVHINIFVEALAGPEKCQ
jgi:polyisoprenoid-binding protein YceI